MHIHRAPVAIFLALCSLGCPKRIDFGPAGQLTDAKEVLRAVAQAEAQVLTVKGEAKAKLNSPQQKGALTVFIAVSRPALIHLELLDFFGKPQAVLVSDGARFGLYNAQEGRFYRGPATPQNMARLLPIALPPGELVALMLGQVPRIVCQEPSLTLDPEAQAYQVTLRQGPVTQVLTIHPGNHRVIHSHVSGAQTYDATFGDFDDTGKWVFAQSVELDVAQASTSLALHYTDAVVNESPDLTLFELAPPPGVTDIQEVDERGYAIPR